MSEEDSQELEETFNRIKTHFPSARIKKLMQSDDDIGKVAQATPVVVGRALELFLCSLVDKSLEVARESGSRRIQPAHLRKAVAENEQFDFCQSILDGEPREE
ncbi:NC2 transcription regulator complex subunit [Komagataella phaffii CBS 7435]|uniref:Subunit of a heterodimeric NC2 transcription regulator complex with Ncb2p n=2 Tax=Komagataella phaffii TaxID=460519 RepID=C4R279_KOMPG|nr:Subunit of a heterodimeric NC2 transcription regulator complex with Ncb2p [Komagataella phaffii GS115]AOA62268.1 GQ67_01024T0 [Komagataella phaffii]KAI0461126.1 hypothetical protein LJB42_001141 [Komagataella kurtzmanii]CAH2447848.1 NC2 transcription regulator complex subunit [Komagataella phaffii CBS 7435]AOA67693.1 GQ68_00365T0 [Komagataella phaffii GS115]CAY69603.1 Subunit of a heterodimeric NC2 transcription regulator complex with Ncb2p [Komagataella phaffii GS115]